MHVLLCPLSDPGYLYPALAVGRRLVDSGEQVTVLGRRSAGPVVAQAGLPFLPAELHSGRSGFRVGHWFNDGDKQYRNVRDTAAQLDADVLLTSALSFGALLAGESLDLPVVVLGLTCHLWAYQRPVEEQAVHERRAWQTEQLVIHYRLLREQLGLPPRRHRDPATPLAGNSMLLQGNPLLEHPAAELPAGISHSGPCWWEPPVAEDELDDIDRTLAERGLPAGYVHLGRTFGGESLWPRLNAAFTDGPLQALVEQGRSGDALPGPSAAVTVLRKPWLSPLVERSRLVLTSGTSAPTMGALLAGRPLVMAPAGSEQPLLTEACVRAGVALRLPEQPDPSSLHATLKRALSDERLRQAADVLGARLRAADGPGAVVSQIRAALRGGGTQLAG